MNLTDDITLRCLHGSPIFIGDAICAIYPPTLGDIARIGYSTFMRYAQVLTMTKPVNKQNPTFDEIIAPLNNFQYLLLMTQIDKEVQSSAKDAFRFFTHEEMLVSTELGQIIVGNLDEQRILNADIYVDFVQIIKRVCWMNMSEDEIEILDTDSEQTRKLKQRMLRNREQLRKAKNKQTVQQNKSDVEISDLIASLPLGNLGLNIINVWDITYYAFHDQLKRMGWSEQFDINNRAAMAGAKIKKADLKHWIRGIAEDK